MTKIGDLEEKFEKFKAEVNELLHGPAGNPELGLTLKVRIVETAVQILDEERHITAGKFQEWLEQFPEEEKTPDRLRQILAVFKGAGCKVTVEDDLAEEVERLWENAADAEQDYETARVLAEDHHEEHRRALVQADKRFEEAKERLNASDAQKLLDLINAVDPAEEPASPD